MNYFFENGTDVFVVANCVERWTENDVMSSL